MLAQWYPRFRRVHCPFCLQVHSLCVQAASQQFEICAQFSLRLHRLAELVVCCALRRGKCSSWNEARSNSILSACMDDFREWHHLPSVGVCLNWNRGKTSKPSNQSRRVGPTTEKGTGDDSNNLRPHCPGVDARMLCMGFHLLACSLNDSRISAEQFAARTEW